MDTYLSPNHLWVNIKTNFIPAKHVKTNISNTRIRNIQCAEWQADGLENLLDLDQDLVLTATIQTNSSLLETGLESVTECPPGWEANASKWV